MGFVLLNNIASHTKQTTSNECTNEPCFPLYIPERCSHIICIWVSQPLFSAIEPRGQLVVVLVWFRWNTKKLCAAMLPFRIIRWHVRPENAGENGNYLYNCVSHECDLRMCCDSQLAQWKGDGRMDFFFVVVARKKTLKKHFVISLFSLKRNICKCNTPFWRNW